MFKENVMIQYVTVTRRTHFSSVIKGGIDAKLSTSLINEYMQLRKDCRVLYVVNKL